MRFENPTYVGTFNKRQIFVLLYEIWDYKFRSIANKKGSHMENYCFCTDSFENKESGMERISSKLSDKPLYVSKKVYDRILRWNEEWESRSLEGILYEIG